VGGTGTSANVDFSHASSFEFLKIEVKMPGSSLWLLPPEDHPLNALLTSLISQTSTHFSSPHLFIPHVTLTSDISPSVYSPDPQQWLENIEFPATNPIRVKFGKLNSENVFVRKLYIQVSKDGMGEIAKATRKKVEGYQDESVAQKWAELEYGPHLSLL
jgi:2',3'-cyclic-nucleotide 3'-phosphodiesterase